jgi:5'-nucleotidase / UDP-sugar diphosphatase
VKTTIRRTGLLTLLLLGLGSWIAGAASLTILHTNDTHGHLMPFSYPTLSSSDSDVSRLPERTDIGGIARRATLAAQIRAELEKKGSTVWLIDAGDFCDGTPFSTEYKGEADMAAMNAAGYDLGTVGNHEFSNPLDQLKKVIAASNHPILCANATETSTGKPLSLPYEIRQVGPVRVGIFGLVTREAATYPAAKEGITIAPEVETARKIVPELRGKADIILLISHCGQDVDEELARGVPGIDVIVGGHSHSRLPSGEIVWRSEDLKADEVNGTVIVQAHQWGGELGRLDLLFEKGADGAWKVDRYRARLIPVTKAIPPDPTVAAVVDRYWQPIAGRYGEVVGSAAADFASRGDDRAEYNLVADAVRETYGADVEMENLGGVRSPLVQGPITRGDLVTMDPFNNTVVTFKVTGQELKQILKRYTPAVSGVRYRVENHELVEATVGGQPIDDGRIYTGAANSYFANYALKGITVENTGKPRLDVLIEFIRAKGTIHPSYDGRRVVIGG